MPCNFVNSSLCRTCYRQSNCHAQHINSQQLNDATREMISTYTQYCSTKLSMYVLRQTYLICMCFSKLRWKLCIKRKLNRSAHNCRALVSMYTINCITVDNMTFKLSAELVLILSCLFQGTHTLFQLPCKTINIILARNKHSILKFMKYLYTCL